MLCDNCTLQNREDRACSLDNHFKPNIKECHSFNQKSKQRMSDDWHNLQMKPSRRIRHGNATRAEKENKEEG